MMMEEEDEETNTNTATAAAAAAAPPPPPPTATKTPASSSASPPSKLCLNFKCRTSISPSWKPGWLLRSGRIADLCEPCGLAYEHLCFCETFHSDDAGWRQCNTCKKRVHCGCIASIYSFVLLDTGGVECINCAKKNSAPNSTINSAPHFLPLPGPRQRIEESPTKGSAQDIRERLPWNSESGSLLPFPVPWLSSTSPPGVPLWQPMSEAERLVEGERAADTSTGEMTSGADSNIKVEDDANNMIKHANITEDMAVSSHHISLELLDGEGHREEVTNGNMVVDDDAKDLSDSGAAKESAFQGEVLAREVDEGAAPDMGSLAWQVKNDEELDDSCGFADSKGPDPGIIQLEPSTNACLTMSLGLYMAKQVANDASERTGSNAFLNFTNSLGQNEDARDENRFSCSASIRQRQKQPFPKPPQSQASTRTEIAKDTSQQAPVRVARPPGEGRGRNQLLPRYWPRITDQELQQITSGDSNSIITPLFEKMLSASDAGRIGRLVLPKACAEAYFPPISQPEGLPLKIQDVTGKDWLFQFRFWPNNNSRMYVLEGVTPCIQSMQLQAGDTVTFSRLDPEGKLIMGYRRAPNSLSSQDSQPFTACSPSTATAPLNSGGIDNLTTIANFSGLISHSVKGGTEAQSNGPSGPFNVSDTGYGWYKTEKQGIKPKDSSFMQSVMLGDKRRRHLGSKSKRLRLDVEDSVELKMSWEEVQELLRPPLNVAPSIVTVEGHEFEEYEEPPVFGKRTIFIARQGRPGEDQWAQCDDCGSWRRVPVDVFLPTRWTCADNVWDSKRAACAAPQEVDSEEIDNLLRRTKEVKKQDVIEGLKVTETPSGLEALANAATLGENNVAAPPATTKHPRHRPGCTCIVCIQPPSGKGPKHKPTCTCNVCMTVKRRFKTLMMRRKKRQSEREAESARKKRAWAKEEGEVNSGTNLHTDAYPLPENGSRKGTLAVTFPGSLPRMGNFSSNGNRFSPNVTLSGSYPSKARAVVEEHIVGKASIDLNSQPERDDEPNKGTGRLSMTRLVQSANYPIEMYLKQHGLTSLVCPQQMLTPTMGFAGNLGSMRTDDHTSSQSAVLTSERPQDDKFWVSVRAKADTAIVPTQNFDLMEQKSAVQVSSQSS